MKFYLTVKKLLKIYKLPLLSGVFFGCAFIPFPFFSWFFALVPLWFFIYRQKSLKRVLIGAFLTQFLATFIGFNWVMHTAHIFGGMNLFVSFLVLLLFCCLGNLYVSISAGLWHVLSRKTSVPAVRLLLFPLLFSLFHSLIPTLFPWNMGYPWLWGGLWGFQTAELWGFRFLNTLFYVFNLLFLIIFYHIKSSPRSSRNSYEASYLKKLRVWLFSFKLDALGKKALGVTLLLFLFLNLLGFYLGKRLPDPDGELKVIIVQHNLNAFSYRDHKNPKAKVLLDLRNLTYQALQKAYHKNIKRSEIDFILWPEGAYPYPIKENVKQTPLMRDIIRWIQVPIITGGASLHPDQKIGNSVFVFDRAGRLLRPVYNKVKLLAFGETFPLIDRFSILRKMFPYFGSNMTAGESLQPLSLEGVSYGWQVCYEVLFDRLAREFSRKKSQILINVSNDSWYGQPQQPLQHLTMSFARAIELRQSMIRATNTGFSGVITSAGEIQKPSSAYVQNEKQKKALSELKNIKRLSPFNRAWAGYYKVPYYKKPFQTLFMGWGYFINEMFLLCLALWIVFLQLYPFRK